MSVEAFMNARPLLCASFMAMLAAACGGGEQDSSAATPAEVASVAQLAADAPRYLGRMVELRGTFLGFQVADCNFPKGVRALSITRSDWGLKTGFDCIYVSGGFPAGIDPIDTSAVHREAKVNGMVMADSSKLIYLKLVSAELAQ
jgi:hypothetical protein